jgi:hypothetical protein
VKPIKGWKKRRRGKKQAAGRCEEPKELTWGENGSQRKLAATCRKVFCHAEVARCKKKSSGKLGPREIVNRGRDWPQLAGKWPTVQ